MKKKVLTTDEAAELLGTNRQTIKNMIDRGSIRGAYKLDPNAKSVYRIPADEVERILKERSAGNKRTNR